MGKFGRCVRLTTLPPSCTVVMKSGNLNFLEPSGPLQACNGTDLPLLRSASEIRPQNNFMELKLKFEIFNICSVWKLSVLALIKFSTSTLTWISN